MLEKVYKRALETHNKKLLAVVLSSLVGFSGCAALKNSDKNLEGTIYNDKFIVDVTNNSGIEDVLMDKYGKKLELESDVDFFIVDKKEKDGTWKVTIACKDGTIYEGLIKESYISDLSDRLEVDKGRSVSEENKKYLLKGVPGALFEYGPGNYKDYKEYFYDERDDEIDFRTKTIAITKEASDNSEVIKYLTPGDVFVLLPEEEVFEENNSWNKVATVITNENGETEITKGYMSGSVNLNERFYFRYLGTNITKGKNY